MKKNAFLSDEKLFLTIVLAAAFIIRVALFRYRSLPEGDGCHYVSFAKDFLRGDFSSVGTYWSVAWPGLIALFSLIFRTDVELSGRLLNALFGTGLVAVSYFLAKRFFNQTVARYAVLLTAVNLYLINYSTYLFTECLYTLLMMMVVFLGWVSLEKQKNSYFLLLGLLIGLTYTVRSEVLAFAPVFFIPILIKRRKKAISALLIFCMATALFVLAMAFFYRVQHGRWTIGDKGSINFIIGEDGHTSYRAVAETTEDSESRYLKSVSDEIKRNGLFAYLYRNKFFVGRLTLNYKRALLYLPRQFLAIPFLSPALFWFFFLLGSCACWFKDKTWRIKYLYLLLFPAVGLTLVSLCFMEERKTTSFIPVFILINSIGVYHLETLLRSRKIKAFYYVLCAMVLATSSVMAFEKAKVEIVGDAHLLMKEAGLWMRAHLSQEGKTMLHEPVVTYYFYEKTPNHLTGMLYTEDYAALIRKMRYDQARYLVIYSWHAQINPVVDYLFKSTETAELELLKGFRKDDLEVRVYQLR